MPEQNNNNVYKECPVCGKTIRSNGLPAHLKKHEKKGEYANESENGDRKRDSSSKKVHTKRNSGERGINDDVGANEHNGVVKMDSKDPNGAKNVEQTIRIIEGNPKPEIPQIVQSGMDKFLDRHGDELIGIASAVVGTLIQNIMAKNNPTAERQEGMVKDILGNPVKDF